MLIGKLLNKFYFVAIFTSLYISSYIFYAANISIFNIVIVLFALCFFLWGMNDFGKNKFDFAPIFNLSFFSVLLLSCINFSRLQKPYEIEFLALIVIGGGGFSLALYLIDKIHVPVIKTGIYLNQNMVLNGLIFTYIILKLIIIYKTGFRLDALLLGERDDGGEYVIPGVSGLAAALQWVLLIAFPYFTKRKKFIIVLFIIFFAILAAKRGDIVRLLIFLVFYVMFFNEKYLLLSKIRIKGYLLGAFLIFVIAFSHAGNVRQEMYDNNFSIVSLLEANIDSAPVSWFLGYTGFNFEVLSRIPMENNEGVPMNILASLFKGLYSSAEVATYYERLSANRISGFNASTFLGPMVYDLGQLFWIELLFFSFLFMVLVLLIKSSGADGGKIFIMALISLLPFGNYFLSAQFFYAIIISFIIFLFIKKETPVAIHE